MALSKNRISYLLEVYSNRKATPSEEEELFEWVKKGNEQPIKKHIEKLVSDYNLNQLVPAVEWERMYERIMEEKDSRDVQPKLRKMTWVRWAAAAVVLLLLGSVYYYIGDKELQKTAVFQQPKTNDIAPPNSVNAVLTLGNGQKIILDSAGNGVVALQGTVNVVKLANGQLVYKGSSERTEYNTLSNPKGSKVLSLVLSDGSKVWLNAASTLKYPTAFAGNERKVEVTGEAYFEVSHNAAVPFIVNKGETSVRVLGTHFNVSAYDDETSLNITLLEGSVKVINGNQKVLISPGEQAEVSNDIRVSNQIKVHSADVDQVMAWKNGLFSYKGADIETIMRQVSRWYNVDVVFEKPVTEKFYAQVSRNTDVSSLLKMLEATKAVHFKIEGKMITVRP
jgi:ferric-dicitrate binding protein FerR (iron transport regulator)